METLLQVHRLRTSFFVDGAEIPAVNDVSFDLKAGEVLGVVGESGCGKSVMSLSILRLVPDPPGRIVGGKILFRGKNLLDLSEREMEHIRGNEISMIFQEPMTSLNPVMTVGTQIGEVLRIHRHMGRAETRERAVEMLRLSGIPLPECRLDDYPHQMSGGMRQRVMIAMGLACQPALLIADEPTTALDVTIQAQILDLMRELKHRLGTAIVLITHNLGIVADMAERILVMYAGKMVEYAPVASLFDRPLHPYTRGLLAAIPRLDRLQRQLHNILGALPTPGDRLKGCLFHPRCAEAQEICRLEEPELCAHDAEHFVACWKHCRS